jgi:hypothetical protein
MAASLYASLSDVRTHLPDDKTQISDGEDDLLQIDAKRLIDARLAGTLTTDVIATWLAPATTPPIIREIAGKIIAAKWYAILVSEDEADGSRYAQDLYNEAIAMINDIRNGTLTVIGVDGIELSNSSLVETSFWPNDDTPGPSFAVEEVWS